MIRFLNIADGFLQTLVSGAKVGCKPNFAIRYVYKWSVLLMAGKHDRIGCTPEVFFFKIVSNPQAIFTVSSPKYWY